MDNGRRKFNNTLSYITEAHGVRFLEFLNLDNIESLALNIVAKSMKEKLSSFTARFKKICHVQSTWCVLSLKLREEIITSLEINELD
ncbi:hypothetical protein Ahy_A07g032535 [Arachis hypogaea]|uniref:Exocyst complex subunit Exo70 C-terminal domain-containing protein n=1 Tax=Arachis hypogaea TaxID=3818 RepID=A0A445C718_ARAHY|nr:hypothetical protein Ahy_A07g032535 [Arachis hypogaea]